MTQNKQNKQYQDQQKSLDLMHIHSKSQQHNHCDPIHINFKMLVILECHSIINSTSGHFQIGDKLDVGFFPQVEK